MVIKHHVSCAVCGKEDYIEVGNGKERENGWYYYGKFNVNSCKTEKYLLKLKEERSLLDSGKLKDKDAWIKVLNPCYDSTVKKEFVEYWECMRCSCDWMRKDKLYPNEVKDYSESYQYIFKNRINYQEFRFNLMNMMVDDAYDKVQETS